MKVGEFMNTDVAVCGTGDSLRDVALKMHEMDCGVIPVAADDSLVGVVTDRDIVVRAVASGKPTDTPVSEILSPELLYCFEDQDVEDAIGNMAELKVRRLPVVNRGKRLVGIVSLGDLVKADGRTGGTALQEISEQGGPHNQSAA